ncbi:MAG: hypothetical protein JWO68_3045, partial [Actinomycetia bacterium]|nr:hypothetical protein [Actinomycetes bacterium]
MPGSRVRPVKSLLRKVLLKLAAPVRGFFDPRFRDL